MLKRLFRAEAQTEETASFMVAGGASGEEQEWE